MWRLFIFLCYLKREREKIVCGIEYRSRYNPLTLNPQWLDLFFNVPFTVMGPSQAICVIGCYQYCTHRTVGAWNIVGCPNWHSILYFSRKLYKNRDVPTCIPYFIFQESSIRIRDVPTGILYFIFQESCIRIRDVPTGIPYFIFSRKEYTH